MTQHSAAVMLFSAALLAGGCSVNDSFSAETEPDVKTASQAKRHPANRLKDATSPYLLQHAHNPVDWYPWGEEAFEKARQEDKPIFLSVGYSACHWCHVMERECFENEALAKLLNAHFVAVKVDREERPDIDDLYMRYVHLTGQGGGWPMSVFMTPEGEPFFGGTYFPPVRFGQLLTGIHKAWSEQKDKVKQTASDSAEALRQHANAEYRKPEYPLNSETTRRAVGMLEQHFDWTFGGMQAPKKFPPHATLEWLLDRVGRTEGDSVERRMLKLTLNRMQLAGIHDHIGGGFHRYAVDSEWFVPHFEKMLYDNAQLGRVYARAANILGDASYEDTARRLFEWVMREMTSPDGAFYSSLDADSEGVEGKFYIWCANEIRQVLGDEASAFSKVYNVSDNGNFHEEATGQPTGLNIPFLSKPLEGKDRKAAEDWRKKLLEARAKRVRPHLDDKVLTGWNALMIGSLAEAGRQLKEPRYIAASERAAEWLIEHLRGKDGRWKATYRAGRVSGQATLDDHAYLSAAFLDLHAATKKEQWLKLAIETTALIEEHFRDEKRDGFYLVADDHEKLLVRLKSPTDNATPSGNGITLQVLVRLAKATGNETYRKRIQELLPVFHPLMDLAPLQVESLLKAFDQAVYDGLVKVAADAVPAPRSKIQRGPVIAELIPGQDQLIAGERAPIAVRLMIDQGYHVQAAAGAAGVTHPTGVQVASKELGQLQGVKFPVAGELNLPEVGLLHVYEGDVVVPGWLAVPEDAPRGEQVLRVVVRYQACRNGTCEAPQTIALSVPLNVVDTGAEVEALNRALFKDLTPKP